MPSQNSIRTSVVRFCFTLLVSLVAGSSLRAADFSAWKHSGSVWILTTPEGANLREGALIRDFPLLLRLQRDTFDFRQAAPNGADLRITTTAGQSLAYQIESWDPQAGEAQVWVRIPEIRGNARQELKIHWGNGAAKSESSGKKVFDETNGYVSVWHMSEPVRDEVETLPSTDAGTSSIAGRIGAARHFPGGKGIFGGDKIPSYPSGSNSHSTEAWIRTEVPNTTIIGWGNEGGGRGSKVRMLLRSPPHLKIDSDFSDVQSAGRMPMGEWVHVVHTYDREDGRVYINGKLDGAAKPLLNIKSPSRLWIGGWYHNYDFRGDIDEVRISKVARSADWIHLQYENQKPLQSLVGPVVQPGKTLAVSEEQLNLDEGQSALIKAEAGGAQKLYWVLQRDNKETIVAVDRLSYMLEAGRVSGPTKLSLQLRAIYADGVKSKSVSITVAEAIPDPVVSLTSPLDWDGRQPIEVAARLENRAELAAKQADKVDFHWSIEGPAVTKIVAPGKLLLKRAQQSGLLRIHLTADNGGGKSISTAELRIREPAADAWVDRQPAEVEKPVDGQFIARNDKNQGTLHYNGALSEKADSAFLRVFADDQPFHSATIPLAADRKYAFSVKLKPVLVKYRLEFGAKTGDQETILERVTDIICGDAYLIDGQSNAEATDVGKDDPTFTSPWIRSFGTTSGDPRGARTQLWGPAVVRDRQGGKLQIGYWGMELAKRLLGSQKMPICVINGAVGGTRIDQHQRSDSDPFDPATIYGRLHWRVNAAKLTHGIRGIFWHQGENDQGADGPTGGFGYETYRQYFLEMAAGWKSDYPNVQHYYVFQIWPKACSMGINGSDNRLREVQRTLPRHFSRLSVMSTLGVRPPGGCHFPPAGYAEFARLIEPLVERDLYGERFEKPITAANLQRAWFSTAARDELTLEFDQPVVWNAALAGQFYLDGQDKLIASGEATGNRLTLKLKAPSTATKLTYLDSRAWSPDNLLMGENGIAALTFCDVAIEEAP